MALDTRVSFNSDSSEFVSAQPIIYELISRLANAIEENRVRATGRSLIRSDETLGPHRRAQARDAKSHIALGPDRHQARSNAQRC